jgi:hypothetical protein
MFGHFSSAEYVVSASYFLISYIEDDLIHELVGSYLFHCFLFRDRLLEIFLKKLTTATDRSPTSLVPLFIESVSDCAPYFAFTHLQVVQLLRQRSVRLAVAAVLTHLLLPIVDLWHFSPAAVAIGDSLSAALAALGASDPLALRLLDAFQPGPTTEMPEIGRIIIDSGVRFALTRVDTVLMSNILTSFGSADRSSLPKLRLESVASALSDAFVIKTAFVHSPKSLVKLPAAPFSFGQNEDRREARVFVRTLHASVFELAGGLRQFHAITDACGRALALVTAQWATFDSGAPAPFAEAQRVEYAAAVTDSWLVGKVREFAMPGREADLRVRIARLIAAGSAPAKAVLAAVAENVNGCKERYNKVYTDNVQGCSQPDPATDGVYCQYFCDGVEAVMMARLFRALSAIEIDFVDDVPDMPKPMLFSKGKQAPQTLVEGLALVKFYVIAAESAFEKEVSQGKAKLNVGGRLQLFYEIFKRLEPVMLEPSPGTNFMPVPEHVVSWAFGGIKLTNFRACLLQAWKVLDLLVKDKFPGITRLSVVGNPITIEYAVPIAKLVLWFSILDEIPPEYGVE